MNRNSCLATLSKGSAAYVVAHARWQQSRGRRPSMPYLAENNPRKALAAARAFLSAINNRQRLIDLLPRLGTTTPELAQQMGPGEIKVHVRRIVADSSSELELRHRLENELDISDALIVWHMPSDQTGIEARDIGIALGGLVSKSGAMVMIMGYSARGDVIDL